MAEALYVVDVFVRQIDPAGEGGFAVDYQNFPVVTVVVVGGNDGGDGAEHLAADAQGLHFLRVALRQGGELTGAVIQQPDIHTLLHFSLQNLQDLAPHKAFPENKVLQIDGMLRFFQLYEHLRPFVFSLGEIGDLGIGVDREAAAGANVAGQACRARVFLLKLLQGILPGVNQVVGQHLASGYQGLQCSAAPFALRPDVQSAAEYGEQVNHEEPCDFGAGIHGAVHQNQHDRNGKQRAAA